MAGARPPVLQTRGLAKAYGGVAALGCIDFAAEAGEVHAVVGANGAGKSTLMNILSGAVQPDAGEIICGGERAILASPAEARRLGIATVYQEFSLVPQLSVARNIFMGREPAGRLGTVARRAMRAAAAELLARYGLALDPDARVETLSVAQQQLVEIARALSGAARILILDEPTAVLSLDEQRNLFDIIRGLRDRGLLVLYVSHRLQEILAIADRVTVLRDGQRVTTRPVAGLAMAELVTLMIGSPQLRTGTRAPAEGGAAFAIACRSAAGSFDLSLKGGEIVGLAGLVGAGRTSLARAIAGDRHRGFAVSVSVDGVPLPLASPAAAMAAGIAYLTEDRKRDGLFADLGIVPNTTAAALGLASRFGVRRAGAERRLAGDMLERLHLVARSLDMPVRQLSGGNQQKVVLARSLLRKPRLLICDEPTRGVDVGAKAQIHAILGDLAASGVAVLVVSSEIDELLLLCHRILAMRDRRPAGAFAAGASEADILLAISGTPAQRSL